MRLFCNFFQKCKVFCVIELRKWKKHIDFRVPTMIVHDSLDIPTVMLDKRITAFQKILVVLLVLRYNDLWYLVHCFGVRFQHTPIDRAVKHLIAPFIVFGRLGFPVILLKDNIVHCVTPL